MTKEYVVRYGSETPVAVHTKGKIQVSDDAETPVAGSIRWTGTNFEGFDGNAWKTLDVPAGGWTEDAAGNKVYVTNAERNVGIGTTSPDAELTIVLPTASTIGQIIKGAVSQTGNLQEWRNNADTILSSVDKDGRITIGSPYSGVQTAWPLAVGGGIYFGKQNLYLNIRIESEKTNSLQFRNFGTLTTSVNSFQGVRGRGTLANKLAAQDGDTLFEVLGKSWGSDQEDHLSAGLRFIARDTAWGGSSPGKISFLTTPDSSVTLVERMYIDKDGSVYVANNVGIGTITPNQKLTIEGTMSLKEQADANASTAGYGQIWVKNTTPTQLWFTDDAGTSILLSSHPEDAPPQLYINAPGLDRIGKRVQQFLGEIYWETYDGRVIIETFDKYNARMAHVPEHVDLVKQDWDKVNKEKAIKKYLEEEIEVPLSEAIEEVEITEEVESGEIETKIEYIFDEGEIKAITEEIPKKIKQGTGKFQKRLKSGIRLDADTGKLYRKLTPIEAEAKIKPKDIPDMPQWMKDRLAQKGENV